MTRPHPGGRCPAGRNAYPTAWVSQPAGGLRASTPLHSAPCPRPCRPDGRHQLTAPDRRRGVPASPAGTAPAPNQEDPMLRTPTPAVTACSDCQPGAGR